MKGLEAIANMEYPGRLIIIGKAVNKENVVMYAITGRSPSSQARKLEIDKSGQKVCVMPTDEETLKTGNIDLLVYTAIFLQGGIAVSNGKQTEEIKANFASRVKPVDILMKALSDWEYEPDAPNYTPRISGCLVNREAALSIIKRENGSVMRNYFEIPLISGRGKMIATYTGANEKPLPSFQGEPLNVELPYATVGESVNAFYKALGPRIGQPDFRVAVAGVYVNSDVYRYSNKCALISIRNRCEEGKK